MTHIVHTIEALRNGCPYCYSGRKGRQTYKGHYGYRPHNRRLAEMADFVRRSVTRDPDSPLGVAPDEDWSKEFPALWEYMSLTRWPEDGAPRQTSTLLLFTEEGVWKCCFKDRATGMVAWLSAASPGLLLADLELQLQEGTVRWVKDRFGNGVKKK